MTRSASWSIFFVGLTGRRLLKTVPIGIPSPILSAPRKRPIGVLKLPSLDPRPNREVETGYSATFFRPDRSVSRCFRTEISILVAGLFFIGNGGKMRRGSGKEKLSRGDRRRHRGGGRGIAAGP